MVQIPVYVINLDRRPDRWSSVSTDLDVLGIQYQRVSAIDAEELARKSANVGIEQRRLSSSLISMGCSASALSHFKAMKQFTQSNHQFALILEDDVQLASDLPELLKSYDWFPKSHAVVNLEVNTETAYLLGQPVSRTSSGRELREMFRFQYGGGAAAYFISREGALIAQKEGGNLELQISHRLFDMSYSKTSRRLRPIQVVPAMARQKRLNGGGKSDIAHWENPKLWKIKQKTALNRIRRFPFRLKLIGLRITGKAKKIHLGFVDQL